MFPLLLLAISQPPTVDPVPYGPLPAEIKFAGVVSACGNALNHSNEQLSLGSPEADQLAEAVDGRSGGPRVRCTALEKRFGCKYYAFYPTIESGDFVPLYGRAFQVTREPRTEIHRGGYGTRGPGMSWTIAKPEFADEHDPLTPHGFAVPAQHPNFGTGSACIGLPVKQGAFDYFHVAVESVNADGTATVMGVRGDDSTVRETKCIRKGQVLVLQNTGFRVLGMSPPRQIKNSAAQLVGYLDLDPKPLRDEALKGESLVVFELPPKTPPLWTHEQESKVAVWVFLGSFGALCWWVTRMFPVSASPCNQV